MPVERADDHPTLRAGGQHGHEPGGPAAVPDEAALFRISLPPGGGLPPHHHDHLDVFAVEAGGGTFHIDDTSYELRRATRSVVPVGAVHYLEAGDDGASIVVTMLAGTTLVRADDGSEIVPPWVS